MIGIDAVPIERLRSLLERQPAAESRLFTPVERAYCRAHPDPVLHLAGTLATKEAVIKAASLGPLVSWCRRIEVHRDGSGAPTVSIDGMPHRGVHVSISHDGGIAVAVAVTAPANGRASAAGGLKPNPNLVRYLTPA